MKHFYLILCLFISNFGFSQIFSEDFQVAAGVFPAGWTLINNDGLTPAASVNYVNNAWIVRDDFVAGVAPDSCAFSTSWYAPAGTADDWMITPPISITANNVLSWDALAPDVSFADGYEVRISTTTPTIAGLSTVLYSNSGEGQTWTTRTADLSSYAGQTVYIAWRNNSTDKFLLMIDNISVDVLPTYDVAMNNPLQEEYTIRPLSQVEPIGQSGEIVNVGGSPVTNASMTVNVYNGAMANIYTATSTAVPSIAVGATAPVSVGGYTPSAADVYTVEMIAAISEVDGNPLNDTVLYTYVVSDSIYARDNGVVTGSLGIGAGNGGQLGQSFELIQADDLTSVSFFLLNSSGSLTGEPMVVTVYDMLGGIPNVVVAQSDTLVITSASDSLYTLPVMGGFASLAAGTYTVVLNEQDSTLALGLTDHIFTLGTTWVDWPTNPNNVWSNNEDFGFNSTYIIRPNFGTFCAPTSSTVMESTCDSYTWSLNGNTYSASGLYSETILNAAGCDSVITLDLTVIDLDSSVNVVNETITAVETGVNYVWIDCGNGNAAIPGETGQSFTATSNGEYAVIVSDNGCSDTSACVTINSLGVKEVIQNVKVDVFPNPSTGVFQIQFGDQIDGELWVELTDMKGRTVFSEQYKTVGTSISVDARNAEPGVYFLVIHSEKEQMSKQVLFTKK